jgi:hypothetical protein
MLGHSGYQRECSQGWSKNSYRSADRRLLDLDVLCGVTSQQRELK